MATSHLEKIARIIDPSIGDITGPARYVRSRKEAAFDKARAILALPPSPDVRNAALEEAAAHLRDMGYWTQASAVLSLCTNASAPTPASAWASEAESLPDDLEVLREGTLCLKSEYGDNSGRIDAYIVSSGEFFWGGTQTASEQRKLLVIPVSDPFASLKIAVDHIEHMANFISAMNEKHNAGYSFESLGEDMPDIRAALSATGGAK